MPAPSIGSMLDRQKGFGPGFDFLRVALAISVVAGHTPYVATGRGDSDPTWILWFPQFAILVMFFALSGFLIAASGLRLSVKEFLINRGLRIIPALGGGDRAVGVDPRADLHDAAALRLFHQRRHLEIFHQRRRPGELHAAGRVQRQSRAGGQQFAVDRAVRIRLLRGDGGHHGPGAAAQTGPDRDPASCCWWGSASRCTFTGHVAAPSQLPAGVAGTLHDKIFSTALFLGRGAKLPVACLLAIAAYLYRDRIPYDGRILAACCALCLGAILLGPAAWMTQPVLNAVIAPALVYITVFLGVSNLPRLPLFSNGDYSYGIYLHGFPMQQVVKVWLPNASLAAQFTVALVLITAFAAFSWHCIEKPVLKLRRHFSFVARKRLRAGRDWPRRSRGSGRWSSA